MGDVGHGGVQLEDGRGAGQNRLTLPDLRLKGAGQGNSQIRAAAVPTLGRFDKQGVLRHGEPGVLCAEEDRSGSLDPVDEAVRDGGPGNGHVRVLQIRGEGVGMGIHGVHVEAGGGGLHALRSGRRKGELQGTGGEGDDPRGGVIIHDPALHRRKDPGPAVGQSGYGAGGGQQVADGPDIGIDVFSGRFIHGKSSG